MTETHYEVKMAYNGEQGNEFFFFFTFVSPFSVFIVVFLEILRKIFYQQEGLIAKTFLYRKEHMLNLL